MREINDITITLDDEEHAALMQYCGDVNLHLDNHLDEVGAATLVIKLALEGRGYLHPAPLANKKKKKRKV